MIVIDRDETGNYVDSVYRNEQTVDEMMTILYDHLGDGSIG